MQNVAPRLSDTPGAVRHAGPELGEHTDDVLGNPVASRRNSATTGAHGGSSEPRWTAGRQPTTASCRLAEAAIRLGRQPPEAARRHRQGRDPRPARQSRAAGASTSSALPDDLKKAMAAAPAEPAALIGALFDEIEELSARSRRPVAGQLTERLAGARRHAGRQRCDRVTDRARGRAPPNATVWAIIAGRALAAAEEAETRAAHGCNPTTDRAHGAARPGAPARIEGRRRPTWRGTQGASAARQGQTYRRPRSAARPAVHPVGAGT